MLDNLRSIFKNKPLYFLAKTSLILSALDGRKLKDSTSVKFLLIQVKNKKAS